MVEDTKSSKQQDLFFNSTVDSYVVSNARFIRRDWLSTEVSNCLKKDSCRFVLLTAEPGAGKSAFLAQLAQDHPDWPRYFIRRDQRGPLGDVSTHSFLLRIGYQLAAQFPGLFSKENIEIAVKQRVGTIEQSSEVIGAKVGKILASPFYRKVIQIQQHIDCNKGRLTGVQIEEMVIEPRLLDINNLQFMALIDPARVLQLKDPNRKIVILIDALDEIRYHDTKENILKWLINCPELPENVRFVLTSRPPQDQLNLFYKQKQAEVEWLTIAPQDYHVQSDLKLYVKNLLKTEQVAAVINQTKKGAYGFMTEAVKKADGNIGYLDALARGIDQALFKKKEGMAILQELLSLKALPLDIQGLYGFFLQKIKTIVAKESIRVKDQDGVDHFLPAWTEVYKPILGVLSVVYEPITASQIQHFAGLLASKDYVYLAIDNLLQFLDKNQYGYRFYHATLPEFLTAQSTFEDPDTEGFYITPDKAHEKIAEYYKGVAGGSTQNDWSRVDNYGLRHLARHLAAADKTMDLDALISKKWMDAKTKRFGDSSSFLHDVDIALNLARNDRSPNLNRVVKYCALYSSFMNSAPPIVLKVLACSGQIHRAQSIANNITFPLDRCLAFTMLAEIYSQKKETDDADKCLHEARTTLPSMDATHRGMALFWITQALFAQNDLAGAEKVATEALDLALNFDAVLEWDKPNALFWAAKSLRVVNNTDGLTKVSKAIQKMEIPAIRNLNLQTQSVAKNIEGLEKCFQTFTQDDYLKDPMAVRNLSNVALALADAGLVEKRDMAMTSIDQLLDGRPFGTPADAHRRYVWALGIAGEFDKALCQAGEINISEERAKALNIIASLALDTNCKEVYQKIVNLAYELEKDDDWRVSSYLAHIFFLMGENQKAVDISNQVCKKNVPDSLANTLTLPLPKKPQSEIRIDRVWIKSDKRQLQTEFSLLNDEIRLTELMHLVAKGRGDEAAEVLGTIQVPSFRAQGFTALARFEKNANRQLNLWIEALVEARLAGQDNVDKVLMDGHQIIGKTVGLEKWQEAQQSRLELDEWWQQ